MCELMPGDLASLGGPRLPFAAIGKTRAAVVVGDQHVLAGTVDRDVRGRAASRVHPVQKRQITGLRIDAERSYFSVRLVHRVQVRKAGIEGNERRVVPGGHALHQSQRAERDVDFEDRDLTVGTPHVDEGDGGERGGTA